MRCKMAAIRNFRRTLSASVALAAALAVVAVAPCSASAGGLTSVSAFRDITGPTGTLATVTVRCPRGTRVVSGGYDPANVFHPNGSGTELVVNTSRRTGRRAWKVSAYQLGRGDTVRLTATANCSAELGPLMTRTRRVSVSGKPGNPAVGTASAHCPHHFFALSGGFQISVNGRATSTSPNSPPVSLILGSRAVARSWAVTGARMGPGHSSMTAFAYCSSTRPLGRPKVGTLHARAPNRSDRLTTPRCPRGMIAASGGFSARFPMGPGQGRILPLSSGLVGARRWTFTAISQNGDAPFNGFTYCVRRT